MKLRFPLSVITLALFSGAVVAGGELRVGQGETYTVTAAEQDMTLDSLVLEDGATVSFAEEVEYWNLEASGVVIGKGVRINGAGREGRQGDAADPVLPEKAATCSKGEKGNTGGNGSDGGDAIDMSLQLDLLSFGSLEVSSDGGSGGNGGDGSPGQHAGDSNNRCSQTRGGTGGSGGKGGRGGDAGNVSISLSSRKGLNLQQIAHQVDVSAEGGQGGLGGKPGLGGKGSEGRYTQQKSLTGNKKWVEGGRAGMSGAKGDRGEDGRNGRVYVGTGSGAMNLQVAPVAAKNLNYSADPLPASSSEVDLLRQQLEAMQKKLEALDKE